MCRKVLIKKYFQCTIIRLPGFGGNRTFYILILHFLNEKIKYAKYAKRKNVCYAGNNDMKRKIKFPFNLIHL